MTALPEVLEKLERATVGPLEALHPCDPADTWHDVRSDDDGVIVARCQFAEDAEAIAAAVNFLREHGPALLRDAGDGERLRDLHDSIRQVYDITPMLPITAETMDGATEALTAFCMLVGIHKVDIGPYKQKDAAMPAPGGAGGGS